MAVKAFKVNDVDRIFVNEAGAGGGSLPISDSGIPIGVAQILNFTGDVVVTVNGGDPNQIDVAIGPGGMLIDMSNAAALLSLPGNTRLEADGATDYLLIDTDTTFVPSLAAGDLALQALNYLYANATQGISSIAGTSWNASATTGDMFLSSDAANLNLNSGGDINLTSAAAISLLATSTLTLDGSDLFIDATTGGIGITAATTVSISSSAGNLELSSTGGSIPLNSDTDISLTAAAGSITINSTKFGVFGANVTQQATPVTLADVIALLQAFGFAP